MALFDTVRFGSLAATVCLFSFSVVFYQVQILVRIQNCSFLLCVCLLLFMGFGWCPTLSGPPGVLQQMCCLEHAQVLGFGSFGRHGASNNYSLSYSNGLTMPRLYICHCHLSSQFLGHHAHLNDYFDQPNDFGEKEDSPGWQRPDSVVFDS